MHSNKRKIALLTNFLPPYRVELMHELNRNFEMRILLSQAMEKNRSWEVEWDDLDVCVQRTITLPQTWRHPAGFSEVGYLHFPLDTGKHLRSFRPEVIISSELGFRTLGASMAASRLSIPLIVWATLSDHAEQGRSWLRTLLRKFLLARTAAVLVNGEAGRRYLRKFGFDDDRMYTVPYTTNMNPFLVITDISPGQCRRILLVGSLQERKGLIPFMGEMASWGKRNPSQSVELIFVGSGELFADLQNFSLPDNIQTVFMGQIAYEDLPEIYGRADLLAFPTLADEWGLVVNEALAAGRPVLGSLYSQAVEELIEEGLNGWVFRPDKDEEMQQALSRALSTSSTKLIAMGHSCRNTAQRANMAGVVNQIKKAVIGCLREFC